MMARIVQLQVGQMANFSYVVADDKEKKAGVIDPSWDLEKIFNILQDNQWQLEYIINTHTHFDHVLGNQIVASKTGAKIIQHKNSGQNIQIPVSHGDVIKIGNASLRVLYTPGHSMDSICLVLDNKSIFTGDTLFIGGCGRTDLPGGDPKEMYESLYTIIIKLDDDLVVYPGHNYGSTVWSTIGNEKRNNFALLAKTRRDFLYSMGSSI